MKLYKNQFKLQLIQIFTRFAFIQCLMKQFLNNVVKRFINDMLGKRQKNLNIIVLNCLIAIVERTIEQQNAKTFAQIKEKILKLRKV